MFEFGLKFKGGDAGRRAELTVTFEQQDGGETPRPDSMDGHSSAEQDLITGEVVPSGLRFFPVSYSRDELVEEAEVLADSSLGSWLADQPDAVFEEIMAGAERRIWGGAGYLAALTEALQDAYEWSEEQGGV
jgi:hypothetical protein